MKKNLLWGVIFIASALFTACNHTRQANTYTVKGHIDGLTDGDTVQLVPMAHYNLPAYAKTVVKDGQFVFKGCIEEPRCMHLIIKGSYGNVRLMLENADIAIEGKATVSTAHDGTPFYRYDAKVTGSPLTLHLDSLTAVRDTLNAIRSDFEARYKDFFDARSKAYKEKDTKKIAELEQSETAKAVTKEDGEFFQRVESSYNRVIMENKDSYWGPLLLIELTSYLTPDQKETFEAFSQEAQNSYYGQLVKEELYPAGMIGQPVKTFTVKDAEGKEATLASLSEGKKYILIDFWASWCGPCRKEIPNLKEIYRKYADQGFQIVSISIDKREADWQKALKEEGLEWPNFRSNEVADLYKVKAVPTMYLVDGNGILVAQNLHGEELAQKVEEVFAK